MYLQNFKNFTIFLAPRHHFLHLRLNEGAASTIDGIPVLLFLICVENLTREKDGENRSSMIESSIFP